jgi:starch synthase
MDMVFSDTGDLHGGFYDNNAGVDYHVPVASASVLRPPLRIAHVSVEMAPIAKVSPVATSLSGSDADGEFMNPPRGRGGEESHTARQDSVPANSA